MFVSIQTLRVSLRLPQPDHPFDCSFQVAQFRGIEHHILFSNRLCYNRLALAAAITHLQR
jgi:hypothetical protein